MSAPVFDAELALECQNDLGEGIFWDSRTQLLHWVDINKVEVHTLDPVSKKYSVDSYADESQYLTTVAPRASEPGLIATLSHSVVLLPTPTTPTTTQAQPEPVRRKTAQTLLEIEKGASKPTRFNDGAADPAGRFFAGSMTVPDFKDEARRGVLLRLDPDGNQVRVLDNIGTSNGLGWSPDHTKFCALLSAGMSSRVDPNCQTISIRSRTASRCSTMTRRRARSPTGARWRSRRPPSTAARPAACSTACASTASATSGPRGGRTSAWSGSRPTASSSRTSACRAARARRSRALAAKTCRPCTSPRPTRASQKRVTSRASCRTLATCSRSSLVPARPSATCSAPGGRAPSATAMAHDAMRLVDA